MSKPSTRYAPLNQSFDSHRAYIIEAAALAEHRMFKAPTMRKFILRYI